MQFGAIARERGAKVKKQFGPRQKESSESSILKVESHKMKVLIGKRREVKVKKQRRRAGVEQQKLKVLETKVLLGHSPGFVPSIRKVIIWDLLDH